MRRNTVSSILQVSQAAGEIKVLTVVRALAMPGD